MAFNPNMSYQPGYTYTDPTTGVTYRANNQGVMQPISSGKNQLSNTSGLFSNNMSSPAQMQTNSSSDQSYDDYYNNYINKEDQNIDKYIDDLIASANGDYDFIIEQLMSQHHLALGSDSAAEAAFLEEVADGLEAKIGRIPYDYKVGVTRINEDFDTSSGRVIRGRDEALKRLAEDEQTWKRDFEVASTDMKTNQQEELARRGILQGTREDAQGLAGVNTKRLDTDLMNDIAAYDRALGRDRLDVTQGAEDDLFDLTRSKTRGLEDIKTGARRGTIDQQLTTQFGKKRAELEREKQKKQLERERALQKRLARSQGHTEATQAAQNNYSYNYV